MKRTALCGLVATLAVVAPVTALAGLTSVATAAETTATTPDATTSSASPTPATSVPITPTVNTPMPSAETPTVTTPSPTATSPAALTEPTIEVVTVNGSGCPLGTAAIVTSPDRRTFRVVYSNYTAEAGRSIAATQGRKNCQLALGISVSEGYTYAVDGAEYSGTVDLAQGASAVTRANYYFQGMSNNASTTRTMQGPLSGEWQATDAFALTSLVWHPCGEPRHLNVNTELRVLRGTSTTNSSITIDELQFPRLHWARC